MTPTFLDRHYRPWIPCAPPEAAALWRWSNFLHANVETRRSTLLLSMDETNVRLYQEGGAGNLSLRAYRLKRHPRALSRNVPRGATRATMTHVATICNDEVVQRLLPQLLLISKRQLSEAEADRLRALLPANVQLLRVAKAWVNTDVMMLWVRELQRRVSHLQRTHRVILFMDVWRAHLQKHVLRTCGKYGFWPCFIPAKLTWALQPCDTHLFAQYKDKLALECQRRLVGSANGQRTWAVVIESLREVVREVMENKSWAKAFEDNGLTPGQLHVSDRVRMKLGWDAGIPVVGHGLPELHHLSSVMPGNTIIPVEELFHGLLLRERGEPTASTPHQPDADAPPALTNPWHGRTRSTSAQALQPPTVVPGPRPCHHPAAAPLPQSQPPRLPPFLPDAKRMSRQPSRAPPSLPPHSPALE